MIPMHTIGAAILQVNPTAALASFPNQTAALVPLVIAALLIDSMIIAIWYMLGYVLNNRSVKTAARDELYQLIGTAVIMVVVIFALVTFSGIFQSTLGASSLLNPGALGTICSNVNGYQGEGSQIDILTTDHGFGALLCPIVEQSTSATPPPDALTNQIDYPLAAAGVVIENLTYQAIVNLNALFVFDAYVGFLSEFNPTFSVCVIAFSPSFQCAVPIIPPLPGLEELYALTLPFLNFQISAAPYAGMAMVYRGLTSLGVLFTTAVEAFILQLTFTSLFLYVWPELVFIGLILRATPFTRKIGGLFIAVAVGAVLFYPLVFAIQYLTMGHGLGNVPAYTPSDVLSTLPNSISTAYGYNTLTTATLTALPTNCNGFAVAGVWLGTCHKYTPNFYVLPGVENIAKQNGCWPIVGDQTGPVTAETTDIFFELIPFVSLGQLASSLVLALSGSLGVGTYPLMPLPWQCLPNGAMNTLFQLLNAYGIYGITAYLLPILNIMITVSAILGLSGLLGGDTDLIGLSKLV